MFILDTSERFVGMYLIIVLISCSKNWYVAERRGDICLSGHFTNRFLPNKGRREMPIDKFRSASFSPFGNVRLNLD